MNNRPEANLIRPTDDDWYLDGKGIWPLAQVVLGCDACAIAVGIDGDEYSYHDDESPRCRLYQYRMNRWSCVEIHSRIASMSTYREPGWSTAGIAILGRDGQVWILGERTSHSRIDQPDAQIMEQLRLLEGKLYAPGYGGKLFRRDSNGWRRDDVGLLNTSTPVPRPRGGDHGDGRFGITDVALTPDGRDFYATGRAYIARPALFWRPAGQNWAWLGLDPTQTEFDQIRLGKIFADTPDDIWIPTSKGLLLRGNGRTGFKAATTAFREQTGSLASFSSVVRYGEHLYAGGSLTCRLHPDGTLEEVSGTPIALTDQPNELSSIVSGALGVAEGVLWAVSFGMLSRFDGSIWERIPMPAIYRNGP